MECIVALLKGSGRRYCSGVKVEGGRGKGQGVEISHIGPSMFHETNGKAIDLPEMNSSLL